ncbi:MAG: cardiolipin synthase B [Balneolaceae bacterium]|nr:MAG: cardiolipin synthase B [Balneolaceae bacterium]
MNIWFIPLIVAALFAAYLIGGILYFNATPKDKRITEPIISQYKAEEIGFRQESGLLLGRNWVDGNHVEILENGDEIFSSKFDAIRKAEKSITKETYNYWGESIGTPLAEELAAAAKRGVKVHFLMDFVGSRKADTEQLRIMEDAGVEVVRWRQPSWFQLSRFNHRTHRKILVVDGKTAFTEGANAADDWYFDEENGGFRDYHYKIRGPVVNDIQQGFSENWVAATGQLLTGADYYPVLQEQGELAIQVTSSHPREGQKKIRKMFLYAISSARESIRITTAYFFPDHAFLDALAEAAKIGVHIELIVPGENIDQAYFRLASKNRWEQLLHAGVEIYEYQPAMYHAKLLIVDDKFVSVGSANVDNRSFRINDELNVNVLSREFANERIEHFNRDLQHSKKYTIEKLENRSAWEKFAGFVTQILGPHL